MDTYVAAEPDVEVLAVEGVVLAVETTGSAEPGVDERVEFRQDSSMESLTLTLGGCVRRRVVSSGSIYSLTLL